MALVGAECQFCHLSGVAATMGDLPTHQQVALSQRRGWRHAQGWLDGRLGPLP